MDIVKLKKKMKEMGVSNKILGKHMDILPNILIKKFNGAAEFTLGDIIIIAKVLSLSKDEIKTIFFT